VPAWRHHGGGPGPQIHPGAVAGGRAGRGGGDQPDAGAAAGRSGRGAALAGGPVTIDLTHDVEVYGARSAAWRIATGPAGGPPHGRLAETEIVLAAGLGDGTDDRGRPAPDLLRRALAACPRGRAQGGWGCAPTRVLRRALAAPALPRRSRSRSARADRAAVAAAAGIAEDAWHEAIEMDAPRSPVAQYCPNWWPADTGAADPPGSCWTRPGLRRPQVTAPPHPAPRTSGPCRSPNWRMQPPSTPTRHLDEPGRVHPARAVAASTGTVTAPRWRTVSVTASSRRPPALPSGSAGQPAWMWGALLAAAMPAAAQLTARPSARTSARARLPAAGMIATCAALSPSPAGGPARPSPDAAAAAGPRPAAPRSWPGCGHCPPPPDLHLLSLRPPLLSTAASPARRKAPHSANPARLPGRRHALPGSCRTDHLLSQQPAHRGIRGFGSDPIPRGVGCDTAGKCR